MPTKKAPKTNQKKNNLLDEAVSQTGYTRIEIVKIAYMDYLVAQRKAKNMQDVFSSNLPKHTYSNRVNGRKKIQHQSALRVGDRKMGMRVIRSANSGSKHILAFNALMKAQQAVGFYYDRFEALAKQLNKSEQYEIMHGVPLPVNVMADEPKKQSIVDVINSSENEKTDDKKKVE